MCKRQRRQDVPRLEFYQQLFDRVADCSSEDPDRIEARVKIGGWLARFRLALTWPTWPRTETEQKHVIRLTMRGLHSPKLRLKPSPLLPTRGALGS